MATMRVAGGCGSALGGIIFLLVGLGMLGFGGYSYFNTRNQMETWKHTTGEIVDFSRYSDSEGGTSTVPVVRYETDTGQAITAEPYQERNTTVDVNGYRVGDEVEVIYNPDNPRDMFLNDFMHVWFVPTLMGGMGGFFSLIGGIWAIAAVAGALFMRRTIMPQPVVSAPAAGPPVIKL